MPGKIKPSVCQHLMKKQTLMCIMTEILFFPKKGRQTPRRDTEPALPKMPNTLPAWESNQDHSLSHNQDHSNEPGLHHDLWLSPREYGFRVLMEFSITPRRFNGGKKPCIGKVYLTLVYMWHKSTEASDIITDTGSVRQVDHGDFAHVGTQRYSRKCLRSQGQQDWFLIKRLWLFTQW